MRPDANGRLTISRKTAFGVLRTNKRLFVIEVDNIPWLGKQFQSWDIHRGHEHGDLYYADLEHAVPQSVYGSAQRGARPIVILSNNVGNRYSHTVIGAVLTTARKKALPTHVHIGRNFGLPRNSLILTEQLVTLDKLYLRGYIGSLDLEAMQELNKALKISIGTVQDNSETMMLCRNCAGLLYESSAFQIIKAAKEDADNGALSRRCGLCGKKGNRAYRVRIQTSNSPIRR